MFDLDGVLYVDDHGIPGAAEALRSLAARGFRLVFATNNSTKTPETVCAHLEERIGYHTAPDVVVTSGMAAAYYLAGRAETVYVLGGPGLEEAMHRGGIATTSEWPEAEAVVVGLDPGLTYERLTRAVLAVSAGALFVASNVDSTYPTPEGLHPGAGAITASVEAATGVRPVVCGKPNPPMRALVRSRIGSGPVWVVGDRPETDLAMGVAEGWSTVLVLSGVTSEDELPGGEERPDLVVATVAELPAIL